MVSSEEWLQTSPKFSIAKIVAHFNSLVNKSISVSEIGRLRTTEMDVQALGGANRRSQLNSDHLNECLHSHPDRIGPVEETVICEDAGITKRRNYHLNRIRYVYQVNIRLEHTFKGSPRPSPALSSMLPPFKIGLKKATPAWLFAKDWATSERERERNGADRNCIVTGKAQAEASGLFQSRLDFIVAIVYILVKDECGLLHGPWRIVRKELKHVWKRKFHV